MIKPTTGRSLHFHPRTPEDLKTFGGPQPLACILASVISDMVINVGVFTAQGTVVGRTNVLLAQDNDEPSWGDRIPDSFCSWMPFQQGQAGKTDALTPRIEVLEKQVQELFILLGAQPIQIDPMLRALDLQDKFGSDPKTWSREFEGNFPVLGGLVSADERKSPLDTPPDATLGLSAQSVGCERERELNAGMKNPLDGASDEGPKTE